MNITLWGVRGSIPTFNPDTIRYGGNTSCIEVEEEGNLLVLDAGSGIQNLNQSANLSNSRIDLLLTHLHIDHIQGLGFFKPFFDPSKEVHIWGPTANTQDLRTRLGRFFSPPLFPVYFRDLACRLVIHEIGNTVFSIGPFRIHSNYVIHPGPTVGYRIESPRGVFTYIPDHEPSLGAGGIVSDLKWLSGSDLAKEADILLHDAQYTREEYTMKVGWGHTSMPDALAFATVTGAKKILLMHHDPTHKDAQLDSMIEDLRQNSPSTVSFEMAVEGERYEI